MGADAQRLCDILKSKYGIIRDLVYDPMIRELNALEKDLTTRQRGKSAGGAMRKLTDDLTAVRQVRRTLKTGLGALEDGIKVRGCGGLGNIDQPGPIRPGRGGDIDPLPTRTAARSKKTSRKKRPK